MSKMSELAMELDDQAIELGFESYEEAIAKGYEVDYENMRLVDGQELAHKRWVEDKKIVLHNLKLAEKGAEQYKNAIKLAIDFIEEGEI